MTAICRCVLFTLFVLEAAGPLWSWSSVLHAGVPRAACRAAWPVRAVAAGRFRCGPNDTAKFPCRSDIAAKPHSGHHHRTICLLPRTTHGAGRPMTRMSPDVPTGSRRDPGRGRLAQPTARFAWDGDRRPLYNAGSASKRAHDPSVRRTRNCTFLPSAVQHPRVRPVSVDRSLPRCCDGFPDSS